MKMLSEADVITSFRDKALKKLGLDYETLHENVLVLYTDKCVGTVNEDQKKIRAWI